MEGKKLFCVPWSKNLQLKLKLFWCFYSKAPCLSHACLKLYHDGLTDENLRPLFIDHVVGKKNLRTGKLEQVGDKQGWIIDVLSLKKIYRTIKKTSYIFSFSLDSYLTINGSKSKQMRSLCMFLCDASHHQLSLEKFKWPLATVSGLS